MILITAPVHPTLINVLETKGLPFSYLPDITRPELLDRMRGATGLIITTKLAIDREVIDAGPNLKWIGRLGSGMELIDTVYAAEKNILCVSSPEGNSNAVAEHAMGMLLNLLRRITIASTEVKNNIWLREQNRGRELSGRTIGIIGYGNTGQAFAKLLAAFNVTILVFDKYKSGFGGKAAREAGLAQIAKYADVISFHVPLTPETMHMADASFFDALKQQPLILNTSRGAVIDQNALLAALDNKTVSGAGLDVLENENLPGYTAEEFVLFRKLQSHENVLLTPHIAGYTTEAFEKMATVLLAKLPL